MSSYKNSRKRTGARAVPLTASAVLSKLSSFALTVLSVLFVVSCRSQACQEFPQTGSVPANLCIERLTPLAMQGDSARLEGRVRSDLSGLLRLESLYVENSRTLRLQAALDSLGKLKVLARRVPDTVYVKSRDSVVYVPVAGPEKRVEVYVQTKWQKCMTWLGSAALLTVAAFGVPKLLKLIIKVLKRC